MANKKSGADRTIDMFSSAVKSVDEKEVLAAALVDASTDQNRPSETIEQAAERWRANAIATQEFVSKSFGTPSPEKGVFRLTRHKEWIFLEQFRNGKDGAAFHWSGVMFKDSDLYELTSVLVRASKEKQNGNL